MNSGKKFKKCGTQILISIDYFSAWSVKIFQGIEKQWRHLYLWIVHISWAWFTSSAISAMKEVFWIRAWILHCSWGAKQQQQQKKLIESEMESSYNKAYITAMILLLPVEKHIHTHLYIQMLHDCIAKGKSWWVEKFCLFLFYSSFAKILELHDLQGEMCFGLQLCFLLTMCWEVM